MRKRERKYQNKKKFTKVVSILKRDGFNAILATEDGQFIPVRLDDVYIPQQPPHPDRWSTIPNFVQLN